MTLYIVGFGGGSHEGMTIEAENAILSSDIIVGFNHNEIEQVICRKE